MLIKGILSPQNAIAAVEFGADGIVVSNHCHRSALWYRDDRRNGATYRSAASQSVDGRGGEQPVVRKRVDPLVEILIVNF